jgi:hypothetical protein
MLAAHADWSADPRKRCICIAKQHGAVWRIAAPVPVGKQETLFARLLAMAEGGPVALGVDLPLGLPRAYAAGLKQADFPDFLRTSLSHPEFFHVAATLGEVSRARPFYPARGVRGMTRAAHAAALGFASAAALSRACDRATAERPAGAPLFWTLGANQTGKAAIAAWRDMLAPALKRGAPLRLWPFDGPFRALLQPGTVAIAETYPAEAMRQLGVRMAGSKRKQADRARLAEALHTSVARADAVAEETLTQAIDAGFGAGATGEDQFDSLIGLLCVLGVLAGKRPDTAPPDAAIQRWEGWVLGQTALPVWGTEDD